MYILYNNMVFSSFMLHSVYLLFFNFIHCDIYDYCLHQSEEHSQSKLLFILINIY